MVEQFVVQLFDCVDVILFNVVSVDWCEIVVKEIYVDIVKYLNEIVLLVIICVVKFVFFIVGSLLEEKFSEVELFQIVILLEFLVYVKYMQFMGSMQKVLQEKLLVDMCGIVEFKVKQFE